MGRRKKISFDILESFVSAVLSERTRVSGAGKLVLSEAAPSWTSYAGLGRKIVAAGGRGLAGPLFKLGSKSGQVRITPGGSAESDIIKSFDDKDFEDILKRAGLELVKKLEVSDPANNYSSKFEAWMVVPAGGEEGEHEDVAVVFSTLGGTSAAIKNERDFVEYINSQASEQTPITVEVGNYSIPGVVAARETGGEYVRLESGKKQASKADAILSLSDGKEARVSIKLKSADYWLSGDRLLRPLAVGLVEKMIDVEAPGPRIEKDDVGNFYMVTGEGDNIKSANFKFSISPEVQHAAVFGAPDNPVDVILKGNFIKIPQWNEVSRTMKWPGTAWPASEGVESLPPEAQPIGLLRAGDKGKSASGLRRGMAGYPGIRPAIATKKRARKAIDID